jgi:hypothetical protein
MRRSDAKRWDALTAFCRRRLRAATIRPLLGNLPSVVEVDTLRAVLRKVARLRVKDEA